MGQRDNDHVPSTSSPDPLRRLLVSTSAAARLESARHWLAGLPRDAEVLILAPHLHAASELVRAVVSETGSRFGIRRFTPNQLAAHLAAPELARRNIASASSLSLTAVITRTIARFLDQNRLGRFAAAARTPGFPHAVARTFEDLRGARVRPDMIENIRPWGPELTVLVTEIERDLDTMKIADRAAIYEAALTALCEATTALGRTPVLLLDLPMETQLDRVLIAALTERAPAVLATAAAGDTTAIEALTTALRVAAAQADRDSHPPSLARLQRHLFGDTLAEVRPLDDSVSIVSWPNEARECVEIARAVHAHAATGVPFDRMAILLRSPGAYRVHVMHALRRASIPAWFAGGVTLPDPSGRALLALLACKAEALSASRFAEYLSLAQVPERADVADPAWSPPQHDLLPASTPDIEPGEHHADGDAPIASPRAPWRWERLLVDAAVIGGEDRWRRRLRGLAEELAIRRTQLDADDTRIHSIDRLAVDLRHLQDFALPLIARLAALPRQATWNEWLKHLRDLTAAAIREPLSTLAVLAELEPLAPVGPVDLATVKNVLSPRLRDLAAAPATRSEGAVFVGPVEMARGLDFEVVFVPGLAERLFPRPILEDPLLPEDARAALETARLATRESRVTAERLALRLAAGAANRHLALSWPRTDDEKGRARVPSFYALDARRAAEGRLPGFDELQSGAEVRAGARLGWPAPGRAEDAIDDTEYDLAVLAHLSSSDAVESEGAAAYLLSANPHLARALRARAGRWRKRWFPADGLVDPDPEALAALAAHTFGARAYAPTTLESYAACPYRFFLQAIQRLKPRDDIEALETIDPLTRGAFIHDVQFRLLTKLRDESRLPLRQQDLELAYDHLDETVRSVAETYRERLAPAIPRVWEDGIDAIRTDLREWLRRAADTVGEWVPFRFELAFGLPAHARPNADPASTAEPVTVLNGLALRGSIDVIEQRAGTDTLRIIEHKTGAPRVQEGAIVGGGKTLQPLLYAMAAEALLKQRVESGQLYYCTSQGEFTEHEIGLNDRNRKRLQVVIDVIGRSIETGWFPAAPEESACRWCDYRPVCGPREEVRVSRKPADRLADLNALRSSR